MIKHTLLAVTALPWQDSACGDAVNGMTGTRGSGRGLVEFGRLHLLLGIETAQLTFGGVRLERGEAMKPCGDVRRAGLLNQRRAASGVGDIPAFQKR